MDFKSIHKFGHCFVYWKKNIFMHLWLCIYSNMLESVLGIRYLFLPAAGSKKRPGSLLLGAISINFFYQLRIPLKRPSYKTPGAPYSLLPLNSFNGSGSTKKDQLSDPAPQHWFEWYANNEYHCQLFDICNAKIFSITHFSSLKIKKKFHIISYLHYYL